MTEPSSPDLSFDALLAVLSDNNSGAITPEDVRSLAALSRPSIATLGAATVGGPDSAAFKDLFTTQNTLPAALANGSTVTRYALLSQLIDVPGASTYYYNTGHVSLSRSATTTKALGLRYDNPAEDAQPRAFQYEWDIVVESSDQTFWALTFFYLPSGTAWPTAGTGTGSAPWTGDGKVEIHHSEPIYGDRSRTVGDSDKWQATSTGSKTVFLNPGDTIVPVIEYWGLPVGDAPDISTQDGLVKKFSFTALAKGVVTGDWDNDADYWSVESNRPKTQYVLGDRASIAAPTEASLYLKVCTSTTRPAPAVGQMIYETDTGNTLVYVNSFLLWRKPWNSPWGSVGTQAAAPAGGPGYPSGGNSTGTPVTTGFTMSVPVVEGRKYRLTVQGHAYAPANDYKLVVGGQGFAAPDAGISVQDGAGTDLSSSTTIKLYETETAQVYLYDGSTNIGSASVQVNKAYANGFHFDVEYEADATATKTFTLYLSSNEGDNAKKVFHDPTTKRLIKMLAEDLGPVTDAVPPTA